MSKTQKPNIKPLGDRILVKMIDRTYDRPIITGEKKVGGIYIPNQDKHTPPAEGEVVALGTGKIDDNGKTHPFNVKIGDRVIMSNYAGTEVMIEDQKFQLVSETEILGVLN